MTRATAALLALLALPALAQEAGESPAEPGIGAESTEAAASVPADGADVPRTDEAAAIAALEPAVNTSAGTRSVAIDRLDLGTTSITGNQELPKVLYIVPWKRSDLGDLVGRPVNTLLDEVLAPVDPDVFERHLSYYETLHGETQEE
jgi:hypothetical protein